MGRLSGRVSPSLAKFFSEVYTTSLNSERRWKRVTLIWVTQRSVPCPVSESVRMPGLCGPGRLPAARGRAVALRVEPLSKAQRLAPEGLPSLTRTWPGRRSRRSSRGGPFPCPGIAGFMSVMLRMTDARLAIEPARRSLRSVLTRPERHPGHRHARRRAAKGDCFGVIATARPTRQSSAALPWCHAGRRDAVAQEGGAGCAATDAPGELAHRPRRCAVLPREGQPVRQSSHRAPPSCAPIRG
jgi:hypothetical protein